MKRSRTINFTIPAISASLILGMATVAAAASGGEGGSLSHEKLMDLLWRFLNFSCLLAILIWALRKPIASGLGGRRQAIIDRFEDLEAQRAEAERIYREYDAKLSKIDQEVEAIISAAVKQGEVEKDRIIEEANRAAGDIKRQAEMAIQHELAEAKLRLRSEVAEQAVQMAEELIRKNLKDADQNKLIEDYLDKVGAIQ